jgi:hypothetical protein
MWIVAVIPTDPPRRRKIDHHEAWGGIGINHSSINGPLHERAPDLLRRMRHPVLTTSERAAVASSLIEPQSRQKGAMKTNSLVQRGIAAGRWNGTGFHRGGRAQADHRHQNLCRYNGHKNPLLFGYD